LIVSFIGFRMLFPQPHAEENTMVENKTEEMKKQDSPNIAFVPLAMPSTAGPGTIAMIMSSASAIKDGVEYPAWVITVTPVIVFLLIGLILWGSLRSS
ncbi:MarC family protein, partial [Ewingella sp. S1.OA.A_B6]